MADHPSMEVTAGREWAAVPSRQVTSLPAQRSHFMRNHFDDMHSVHMVKICCPGAWLPLVVGAVGVISWYLGEAELE